MTNDVVPAMAFAQTHGGLWIDHASILGVNGHQLPGQFAQWRTRYFDLRHDHVWTRRHRNGSFACRDGFHVRHLRTHLRSVLIRFSDPVVGAQYRWSARWAPRGMNKKFWGLFQGMRFNFQ
jgi:hypothetical protein